MIHARFNEQAHLGNVEPVRRGSSTASVSSVRAPAIQGSHFSLGRREAEEMLAVGREMLEHLKQRLPQRAPAG